jgi:hypothetical protein
VGESVINFTSKRVSDVLRVAAVGVITVETWRHLRSYVNGALHTKDARAVLVDLRQTICLLGHGGALRMAEDAAEVNQITAPVALLVSETYEPMFKKHAWRLARAGLVRRAFTCEAQAFDWSMERQERWPFPPRARLSRKAAARPGSAEGTARTPRSEPSGL